ncbi:hypothetical protein [Arthrobacter mangrovi]|uniref:Uncharacterized protein n=1 Tax=Arthrobacter mangrovi TaxID=2966350 RepID=A0ABQ5MXM5_9MICC|nr:hypothetical protein [Arthrobacter mangrovi]GLB68752.1 hypothetical protein AHIS1636_31940 [Arthrobacter mangrovi]
MMRSESNLVDFLQTEAALEAVAAVEHDRWAHWQRYLHAQCIEGQDGSLLIPATLVDRWSRQLSTPYSELSDSEKDSDREQAREYLAALIRVQQNKARHYPD